MEQPTQFRSAFNGFNREDVVRYMEFINNRHSAQVAQLSNELEYLKGKQDTLDINRVAELERQVVSLKTENESLRRRIAELESQSSEESSVSGAELEAYRRAERVERAARERARQIGRSTAALLEAASAKVIGAADQLSETANLLAGQLDQIREAADAGRQAFQDAAVEMEALNTDIEEV